MGVLTNLNCNTSKVFAKKIYISKNFNFRR